MSHPSDRRSDGPADRRFERMPDRSSDRSGQRRPEGRGGSPAEGRPGERRRSGPQERPFGAGGASRWGGAGLRGRRPGVGAAGDRPAGPGARDGSRPDRPGAGASGRGSFRDGPRRDFGASGERRGSFAERRGSFAERRGSFADRRGGLRERGAAERSPGADRFGERGGAERGGAERGGGERGGGEWRGSERSGGPERWGTASPGRFPGSRRPDRPARPRLPLRVQAGRPGLVAGPVAAAPAEVEGESHAPAAPADLIWGRHSALAALEAGRPLHRIWCTSELRFSPKFLQLLREAKASGVLLEEVTWARLGQISGGAVHQGIVLQPAAAATLQLDTLIEGCRQLGESPLLIAVDGLTDPQNLGAIVRSAEALGAHGLVLPQRRNAGLTGSVAKVAAGALEHLPVARVVNLNRSLDALKQEGYRVIGLAAEGTVTLEEADLSGPLVLVTGSEAEGLSLLTRRGCDQLVRIPLRGTTPSLNASVATALLLYEVARRSWMAGLRGTAPAPRLERPALPEPEPMTVSVSVSAAEAAEPDAATEAEAAEAAEPDAATAEANGATAEADGAAVEAQGLAEEPNQALGSAGLAAVQVEAERAAASIAQILEPSQPTEPTALGDPSALDQPPIPSTAPQDPSPWEPSPSPAPAANRELAADVPPDTGAMASPSTPSPLGEGVGEDEDEDEDEDDATAEEGIAASTQHTGGAPLELSTEAPPPAPLPSAAKIPDALVPEEFGQGSGAGEFDRADAGGAAAPSGQRGGIAASEHPLDGAEATVAATAIPEEFATALASEGAETDPIAITTATGPSGQQPPAGTTLERSPEFNQDVSL